MDKHDLRHELKAAVVAIPQQEKSIRAKKAIRLIEDNALFKQAHSVMAYFPLPDEIDISSALPRWADEKELLLPAMENGLIVPKKYVPQLVRGDFGVMQPEGGPFPIDEIDCIIVPGLGFTLEGARLGRGKGCYDRFLVGTKASKMGLCFSEQILDRLIVEPHDIFMDFVTVA